MKLRLPKTPVGKFAACAFLAVLVFMVMMRVRAAISIPGELGVTEMKLAPCPDTPNCVSTQTDQADKLLPPIPYTGSEESALNRITQILQQLPRTKIVEEKHNYVHAECRSFLFRFVDDVEFLIDDSEKLIHFRSAARVGYSDLGVNRQRMQGFTRKFGES
ncbi:DUF1499 domain-containing protein [Rubinisphaera italica]|uniref:DUF1499 domain-containing protein n=1 Tax=Rubinisphaera italica TaxID=2527969 RepID=A0A5C5XLK2_9PLAN|nr:DUF1499 domain-containing protein [Rubinisphaera italica]TWT62602.1 hypothetical protein Pan54_33450 [Rubinisphaera italica]